MAKHGPIIVVEDDQDDEDLLKDVFKTLNVPNAILSFSRGDDVLHYLRTTTDKPFIIISDVHLAVMSGLELKETIEKEAHLKKKSIPFVFFTSTEDASAIEKSYELGVQGYFVKRNNYPEIKNLVQMILHYWQVCRHPNNG